LWVKEDDPKNKYTFRYTFKGLAQTTPKPNELANLILLAAVTILWVLFLAKLIHLLTRDKLSMRANEVRFGTLYEELDYENYPKSKAIIAIFIAKRVVFTLMCVLLIPGISYTTPGIDFKQHDNYVRPPIPELTRTLSMKSIMIITALLMSLGSMAFLANRSPYVSKVRYRLECLNEVFLYLSILCL
jgi:hypothetical protein